MKNYIKHFAALSAVAVLATMVPIVPSAAEPVQSNDSFDASMVFATETRLNVYVDGQWSDTLSDSYGFGDTVTITAPSTIACTVATFAAVQEGHLIRTGSFSPAVGD